MLRDPSQALQLILFSLVLAIFEAGVLFRAIAKCPFCEKPFYHRGSFIFDYHNTFTNKRLNCGIAKYGPFSKEENEANDY
jgi:hypothetical protein